MAYFDRIKTLTQAVPTALVDFELPRDPARPPTQASSNFITNKEQGDWAEHLVFSAINKTSKNFVAIKYGKSDNLVAGQAGFDTFYREFQDELETIGKRPDLLIFKKADFNPDLGYDISKYPHNTLGTYIKKAIAGIEVRSSAFLLEKYEAAMQSRMAAYQEIILTTKDLILTEFQQELNHPSRQSYIQILQNITPETIGVAGFRIPGWSSTERLSSLNNHLKALKNALRQIQKRDYLSITPKVEDLKVVYKWIECFNVPHFYFQVFFDNIYGISFEQILSILADPNLEGNVFSVEKDVKNQNKTTLKIKATAGKLIASKIDEPAHESVRKEMDRGRLLFHVTFKGGTAYLDVDQLADTLGINLNEF
jgi:type II restriction enzyme